ncbi:MAG: NosD domain-containing protein, partial [Betaproteobacteria bacterium]
MKKAIDIGLFLGLLVALVVQAQPAVAQQMPIIIQADGAVNPTTVPIQQLDGIYKITADINLPIIVEKSDIVLDGQGFTIQSIGESNDQAAITLRCSRVTVTNFHVSGWQIGVHGVYDGNIVSHNNFTSNHYDVAIYADNYQVKGNYIGFQRIVGNNNTISENVICIPDLKSGFWISQSSGVIIEANDVILKEMSTSFISSDNSSIQVRLNNFLNIEINTGGALLLNLQGERPFWDGNYWSDYHARYPNASEIDNSGIWDTPYVSTQLQRTIDRSPLVSSSSFSQPSIADPPTQTPIPSASTNPSPDQKINNPDALIPSW